MNQNVEDSLLEENDFEVKLKRIEKSRERLISRIDKKNLTGVREKVAFILNNFPKTRNSDIELAFKFWESFHPDNFGNGKIDRDNFSKLTRYTSITRARAKIQNEFGLYRASEHVRNRRIDLSEQNKEQQLSDKPDVPVVEFYLDESSKTSEHIAVGGLCSVDVMRSFRLAEHLREWKEKSNIEFEFHFSKMSKNKLDSYKEFFLKSMEFSDAVSFKVSVLRQVSISRSRDEIIQELYRHFIGKAIDYELENKRASLPRQISITKDKEGEADAIIISKIEEALRAFYVTKYNNKLTLRSMKAVDSKEHNLVQLADLFIGSVARVVNRKEDHNRNHKDEFSDYILSMLGIDIRSLATAGQDNTYIDFMR